MRLFGTRKAEVLLARPDEDDDPEQFIGEETDDPFEDER